MNIQGAIIMILSITLVTGLAGFCVIRILKGDGKVNKS